MMLHSDIESSLWVDGLSHQVRLCVNAFTEIERYMDEFDPQDTKYPGPVSETIEFIQKTIRIYRSAESDEEILSESEKDFLNFTSNNILYIQDIDLKLKVPVYTYIKPQMGHQFILHILLSMGRFETELDLTLHSNLRNALRYAKLIGGKYDKESLKIYSNQLTQRFVTEQLVYFPNSYRVLDTYIIHAAQLFYDIIICDMIPITDLPPVLQSTLNASKEADIINYWKAPKSDFVEAAITEIGPESVQLCNIPCKEEFENASMDVPIEWDAKNTFQMGCCQSN